MSTEDFEDGVVPTSDDIMDKYLIESVGFSDVAKIDALCMRLASDLATWNRLYAEAHKDYLLAKVRLDQFVAKSSIVARTTLEFQRGKVASVEHIKSTVEAMDDWVDVKVAVALADAERLRLKGICEALVAKKDMLQSVGAKLRIEMQGELSMRTPSGR